MSPENTHKIMGFYIEVFILGVVLLVPLTFHVIHA